LRVRLLTGVRFLGICVVGAVRNHASDRFAHRLPDRAIEFYDRAECRLLLIGAAPIPWDWRSTRAASTARPSSGTPSPPPSWMRRSGVPWRSTPWTPENGKNAGEEQRRLEVNVTALGASLRWATAKLTKQARRDEAPVPEEVPF
jgi:hypothetical protein